MSLTAIQLRQLLAIGKEAEVNGKPTAVANNITRLCERWALTKPQVFVDILVDHEDDWSGTATEAALSIRHTLTKRLKLHCVAHDVYISRISGLVACLCGRATETPQAPMDLNSTVLVCRGSHRVSTS